MVRRLVGHVLLLTGFALAQTGLPTYSVLLGGPPTAPIVINNSSHRILAYTLMFDKGNGAHVSSTVDFSGALRTRPLSSAGIGSGESHTHGAPLGTGAGIAPGTMGGSVAIRNAAGAPSGPADGAVGVALDSLWFDDGTFVGPDKASSFDQLMARLQAEKDVHAILVDAKGSEAAWVTLSEMASGRGAVAPAGSSMFQQRYLAFSRSAANQLVLMRAAVGDARAMAMAQTPVAYPKPLKVSE